MKLNEYILHKEAIIKIIDWYDNYKFIKPLLITGPTGIGKTSLLNSIIETYNINKREYNTSDNEGLNIKKMLERTTKYNSFYDVINKNVSMLLIDDIDTLLLFNKTEYSDLMSAIKKIKQYNVPIIMSATEYPENEDKKYVEIKTHCYAISLNSTVGILDLITEIKPFLLEENKILLSSVVKYDIRQLLIILSEINETYNNFDKIINVYTKKDEFLHVNTCVDNVFNKHLTISQVINYYTMDSLYIPLTVYQYLPENINKDTILYEKCLNNMRYYDYFHTYVFKEVEWSDMSVYSSVFAIGSINQLLYNKPHHNNSNIQSSVINKITQMNTNKRILNESIQYYGIYYINIDNIKYITQLLFNWFENNESSHISTFIKKYKIDIKYIDLILKTYKIHNMASSKKKRNRLYTKLKKEVKNKVLPCID